MMYDGPPGWLLKALHTLLSWVSVMSSPKPSSHCDILGDSVEVETKVALRLGFVDIVKAEPDVATN